MNAITKIIFAHDVHDPVPADALTKVRAYIAACATTAAPAELAKEVDEWVGSLDGTVAYDQAEAAMHKGLARHHADGSLADALATARTRAEQGAGDEPAYVGLGGNDPWGDPSGRCARWEEDVTAREADEVRAVMGDAQAALRQVKLVLIAARVVS